MKTRPIICRTGCSYIAKLMRLKKNCAEVNRRASRLGAVIPLLALLLPVLLLLAAFAINIAYLELSRTEMNIAADAASRAACREMALTGSTAAAMTKGRQVANRNTVSGKPLTLADSDFSFGQSTRPSLSSRYSFTPTTSNFNSVEVTVNKKASSANGPIRMLIPNFFSRSSVESSQTSRSNQIEVDIALVIDKSGSMAYADFEPAVFPPNPRSAPLGWVFGDEVPSPSRWRDAVRAVDVFLTELSNSPSNELVSLTTYSSGTTRDVGLTSNYNQIRSSLNGYTARFNSGQTNIGGGILGGQSEILSSSARQFAAKVMVVLTDGIDTVGSDVIGAANNCFDNKVMVFTITFSNEADQATMKKVADKTLGKHYHATSGSNLQAIFQDIARQLPILISR